MNKQPNVRGIVPPSLTGGLLSTTLPESSAEQAFACIRCGLCCQQLNMNPLYAALDRGDGVCMHYDNSTRLCGIYEQRPLICRVDDSYIHFAAVISRQQYHAANSLVCNQLITRFGGG